MSVLKRSIESLDWNARASGDGTQIFLHPPAQESVSFQRTDWLIFLPLGYALIDLTFDKTKASHFSWHAGMTTVVPPNLNIALSLLEPVEFLCVAIEDDRANRQLSKVAREREWKPKLITSLVDPGIQSIAKEMRRSLLSDPIHESVYFDSLVDGLLSRIACQFTKLPIGTSSKEFLSPGTVRQMISLIESKIGEKITVEDLANEANLSRSHFTRAFKATFGESPQNYIIDRRVKRAQLLLESNDLTLVEIAEMVGFSSPSHFSRAFKNSLGITPAKYRFSFKDIKNS